MRAVPARAPRGPIQRFRSIAAIAAIAGLLLAGGCRPARIQTISPPAAKPPAISVGAHFVDVAATAGIAYRWEIPGPRPLTLLQTIGNGCAFLDYDNDGCLDILLVGPRLALFKGDGHGHFRDVSRETGLAGLAGRFLGCAVGDYDNDGYPDIYISAYRGGILLHNEAGKRFSDVTRQAGIRAQPWGTSCAFGDVDGDGRLDLYVANYLDFGPHTVPQLCKAYGVPTACGPLFYKPERGTLYHNLGGGRFTDVTQTWQAGQTAGKGLGAAFGPFGRSPAALAIANDEEQADLLVWTGQSLRNTGVQSGMAYSAAGQPQGGMGVDWGDYDNDGTIDLAVATFAEEAKAIYRQTDGRFEEQSQPLGIAAATRPYVAFGIKWFDYDNDGWLDLAISNGHVADNIAAYNTTYAYRQPTQLFHNLAGTKFEEVGGQAGPDFARPLVGRGLAVGDFDNDGRLDLLVVDSEGAPMLLHNETAPVGHWLLVKLVGTHCCRDAFGALVTAEMPGRRLVRLCHSDGSYLSASDPRVHFGLGGASAAILTVRWPDGRTDRYPQVAADQIVTLREGGGSRRAQRSGPAGAGRQAPR